MQKGLNKVEGAVIYVVFSAMFLIGAYAVSLASRPLAIASLAAVLYLWYYLHRIRICNFCDQSCPYRPRKKNSRYTQIGFTKTEKVIFYPAFGLISALYIAAIYILNVLAGLLITALLVYALVLYRRKVCVNCSLPCPINPTGKK